MSSMEEYLKKYTSGPTSESTKKKKKKKEAKQVGLRIIEDDAFANVEAARQKEIGSDEEKEEIEVIERVKKTAKVVSGFKKTFADATEIKKEIDEDEEQPRRRRHDSDNSPARKGSVSPVAQRRRRHDSDNSPPRKSRARHDSDNSPPRKSRTRHDSDNSPPRKSRTRHDSDNSPPRKTRKRHDSDNSPPRRSRTRHDSDNSPPRKSRTRHDSDESPPRKQKKRYDSDESPPRRKQESSRRVDPPKKIKEEIDDNDAGPSERKTLDGKKAGLQTAKALREEGDRLREKENKMFDDLDESISGRNAETMYRKKQFRKGGKDDEEKKARREREEKKTEELKEKYKDMNQGIAQMLQRKAQLEEMARVAEQPFTRTATDVHMNESLKEDILKDDPMAEMLMRKRREEKIDRGELVYPTYRGAWNPNRFNIPPGYRWDGVDRSNGFEGQMARAANNKRAESSEFYKAMNTFE